MRCLRCYSVTGDRAVCLRCPTLRTVCLRIVLPSLVVCPRPSASPLVHDSPVRPPPSRLSLPALARPPLLAAQRPRPRPLPSVGHCHSDAPVAHGAHPLTPPFILSCGTHLLLVAAPCQERHHEIARLRLHRITHR